MPTSVVVLCFVKVSCYSGINYYTAVLYTVGGGVFKKDKQKILGFAIMIRDQFKTLKGYCKIKKASEQGIG